jgi:hypothetical protein
MFDVTRYFLQHLEDGSGGIDVGTLPALHKSPEWAYECEWRLINPGARGKFNFMKPSAIYLGGRVSADNKTRVEEMGQRRGIPVIPMRLAFGKFKVEPDVK